jgi:protein-S-isoprenylcysteine O-methyltransferase Ste14
VAVSGSVAKACSFVENSVSAAVMSSNERRILATAGFGAVFLFVIIYGFELLPPFGSSVVYGYILKHFGSWVLLVLNVVIALAFLLLLPYRKANAANWRSHGVFVAFIVALMTEMLGWPLLIFLVSPLVKIPILVDTPFFRRLGELPGAYGTAASLAGLLLIVLGWVKIHQATGLVTTGLYRYVRHPQYMGIVLFTLGWLIHWPTVMTLVFWPILTSAYVLLGLSEERQMVSKFGKAYVDYAKNSRRFIPFVI